MLICRIFVIFVTALVVTKFSTPCNFATVGTCKGHLRVCSVIVGFRLVIMLICRIFVIFVTALVVTKFSTPCNFATVGTCKGHLRVCSHLIIVIEEVIAIVV